MNLTKDSLLNITMHSICQVDIQKAIISFCLLCYLFLPHLDSLLYTVHFGSKLPIFIQLLQFTLKKNHQNFFYTSIRFSFNSLIYLKSWRFDPLMKSGLRSNSNTMCYKITVFKIYFFAFYKMKIT